MLKVGATGIEGGGGGEEEEEEEEEDDWVELIAYFPLI
jgi:hypothetical protein